MNTNLELTNAQTVNTVKAGKKYNFDQYDLVENKGSNMQDIYIVVSHLKNDNPFTGEIIKNGMWKDLNFLETKKYLDYLIKNNLLLRELPDINNALFEYYNEQNNFNFYYYDGTKEPKKILDLRTLEYEFESLYGTKNATKAFQKEFVDIMSENLRAAEYQRKQPFIEGEFELWINPTIEQLQEYNEMQNLDPSDNLENFIGYEHIIEQEITSALQKELKDQGYFIFSGDELLETLKEDYKKYNILDMSFHEWAKPVDFSHLEKHKKYVVDGEISFKPIDFRSLIDNQYGLTQKMNPDLIPIYIKHLKFTKKGLQYNDLVNDNNISLYHFNDLNDYLSIEEFESFDVAHEKISNQNVELSDPFIEVSLKSREYYRNTKSFTTYSDLFNYINGIFDDEKMDLEIKYIDFNEVYRETSKILEKNVDLEK